MVGYRVERRARSARKGMQKPDSQSGGRSKASHSFVSEEPRWNPAEPRVGDRKIEGSQVIPFRDEQALERVRSGCRSLRFRGARQGAIRTRDAWCAQGAHAVRDRSSRAKKAKPLLESAMRSLRRFRRKTMEGNLADAVRCSGDSGFWSSE
jgi:hypothetical protein